MNCKCKVEQRRLTPGVFNLKQFLNGSETMVWEVDNCIINGGTCNLADYDAFLTLSVGGEIDEIMLTKRQTDDKMQLIWDVAGYATSLTGYVKYQIAFRSAQFDTLGVIANDPEANGIYQLVDVNTFNTSRVFRKAENGYIVKWDAGNGRWALYKADGVTVVDYQTTPSQEPHCGVWDNIGVGNNEAAAWISDEAIMYISDSIAADQKITGNFPTILRQLWARISKAGVASVNKKTGIVELFPEDIGAAKEVHEHDYLPLNGGQMTTTHAIARNVDNSCLVLSGGTGRNNDGSQFFLCGEKHSSLPGGFQLMARNASKTVTLQGDTSGALTWGSKPLVLKINGNYADATGNITASQTGCLPLAGGQMTGSISTATTSSFIYVQGANTLQAGASLLLTGKDYSTPGVFQLSARSADGSSVLAGTGGGGLTWSGKNIVRSVNNINADAAGNVSIPGLINTPVSIPSNADLNNYKAPGFYKVASVSEVATLLNSPTDKAFYLQVVQVSSDSSWGSSMQVLLPHTAGESMYIRSYYGGDKGGALAGWTEWKRLASTADLGAYLPLAGGQMTGTTIQRDVSSSYIHLLGGNGTNDTDGQLVLYGANTGQGQGLNGSFALRAATGATYITLAGLPNGTLTWGGRDVVCVESWRAEDGSSWYRKYSDGWVEQGGKTTVNSTTITFPVPFADANAYYMSSSYDNNGGRGSVVSFESRTTTSTVCRAQWNDDGDVGYTTKDQKIDWYACGQAG